mgnify:CR=1 FL=1
MFSVVQPWAGANIGRYSIPPKLWMQKVTRTWIFYNSFCPKKGNRQRIEKNEFLISENDFLISENRFFDILKCVIFFISIMWISDIKNYIFLYQKILHIFWYQKIGVFLYPNIEFLTSENDFLISENRFLDIRK